MYRKSSRPKKPSEKAAAMASSHSRNNTRSRPPKSKASPKHVGKWKKAPSSEEESPSESDDSIVKEMRRTSKKKVATKRTQRQSQAAIEVVEDSGPEDETQDMVGIEAAQDDGTEFEEITNPSGKEQDEGDEVGFLLPWNKTLAQLQKQDSDDGPEDRHDTATLPEALKPKNKTAEDLLTVFSEKCTVKFVKSDGGVEQKRGHWCNICK